MKKYIPIAIFAATFLVAVLLLQQFRKLKFNGMEVFKNPVNGRVSSKFGNRTHPVTGVVTSFHNGVDIAVPSGTAVKAPLSGKVVSVVSNSVGGKQILIDHHGGYRTGYAHLSEQLVAVGEEVKQGQIIAKSGNTGQTTGPHLHFTLRQNGELVNPEDYFSFT